MTLNCVIYARSASSPQGERATDRQVRACHEIARSKGWEVVEVCVDEPGSGHDASRPALAEALALVRSGRAQVLLAQDVERFTRDPGHFIAIHRKVEAAGAQIITLHEGVVDDLNSVLLDPAAMLRIAHLAGLAQPGGRALTRADCSAERPRSGRQRACVNRTAAEG